MSTTEHEGIAAAFERYAAERYEAYLIHPEVPAVDQPKGTARWYRTVADDLRAMAARYRAGQVTR